MASRTPIAIAALGASLDAPLDAVGVDGLHEGMSPRHLVAKMIVTGAGATVRLFCFDEDLARWVPSKDAAVLIPVGVAELHWDTYGVPGHYALVQTIVAGTVDYVLRSSERP